MLSHCLLASMVSHEKSAINFIENSLYVRSHFSLAAFKTLMSLSFVSLIMMCLGTDLLHFILCRVYWVSWMCFSSNLGNFGHYVFKYSFWPLSISSPSWTPTMHMLVYVTVFHRSLSSGYFSSFFFLFVLKIAEPQLTHLQVFWLSSACPNLLLSPSG